MATMPRSFTSVYVFGDSLVDAGNALELAETYDDLPFASLPEGAPTSDKGYFDGRFSDGYTFADLLSNKFIAVPSEPVFPYRYEDPWLGISYPFESDPGGKNLNFAYGGAQIRQGSESVPDFDAQTDAYKDAVDNDVDAGALHLITLGGNDVRSLVPATGAIADLATATAKLTQAADKLVHEIDQLIDIGGRSFMVTGIPDVGIIPHYNGRVDEAARREAATLYSAMLDEMIRTRLTSLQAANPTVAITFVSLTAATDSLLADLSQIYPASDLYPLADSEIIFFDHVHPTAQAHALLAGYILDTMYGPAGSLVPLDDALQLAGSIGAKGEVDTLVFSLAANTAYTFEMLGLSSGRGSLADPTLRILAPDGSVVAQNDDAGLGLDSVAGFTSGAAGEYRVQLSGVGGLTGTYAFQALGNASGDNVYNVKSASALIVESAGGGNDAVYASVSFALGIGAEVETLATSNVRGKGSINLTGNEFAQAITGNAGANVLDGKGGADDLWGKSGIDRFAFTTALGAGNVDRIMDFSSRDDTITLDDAVFAGLSLGTLASGAFRTGTAAADADDRIIYDRASGTLLFDPDGIGPQSAVPFAVIANGASLNASDFLIV